LKNAVLIQNSDTLASEKKLSSFYPIRFSWKESTSEKVDSVELIFANESFRIFEKNYPISENQNWIDINLKEFGEEEAASRIPLNAKYSQMIFTIYWRDIKGRKHHRDIRTFDFNVRYCP